MIDYEVICSDADRPAWLAARQAGIGASDAPALLGLGYGSPMSVYASKIRPIDEILEEEGDAPEWFEWGHMLEPLIGGRLAKNLSAERGETLRYEPWGELLRSAKHPFMLSTPDGALVNEDGVHQKTAEIKARASQSDWDEGVPPDIDAQCQHIMSVTGDLEVELGVLFFGSRFRRATVQRNDEFIDTVLVPACTDMIERVNEKVPPPADGSPYTTAALKLLYPADTGERKMLEGHFVDLDVEREAIKARIKLEEARLEEVENEIRAEMGSATEGILPNGVTFTLKTTHRKGYTVEPTTFRALRRRQAK